MRKWIARFAVVVTAAMPMVGLAFIWWIDGQVSTGTVVGAVACSLVQIALLLFLQLGADETDAIARAAHKEVTDAASVDYAAIFNDGLK